MAESIRSLKPEFQDIPEEERRAIARKTAAKKYSELMASKEHRHQGGLMILADLEHLLVDNEMSLAADELMRQAEVLAWGTLEVLANDVFIELLNKNPKITETLLKDERSKKRFQMKDFGSLLSAYDYDLSSHMGSVLAAATKIDDVETLRAIYGLLMPNSSKLLAVLRDPELWKLNQRRNLILHRRSIVDEAYLRNTGDCLKLSDELKVSPQQFENDLSLVLLVGSAILEGSSSVL